MRDAARRSGIAPPKKRPVTQHTSNTAPIGRKYHELVAANAHSTPVKISHQLARRPPSTNRSRLQSIHGSTATAIRTFMWPMIRSQ